MGPILLDRFAERLCFLRLQAQLFDGAFLLGGAAREFVGLAIGLTRGGDGGQLLGLAAHECGRIVRALPGIDGGGEIRECDGGARSPPGQLDGSDLFAVLGHPSIVDLADLDPFAQHRDGRAAGLEGGEHVVQCAEQRIDLRITEIFCLHLGLGFGRCAQRAGVDRAEVDAPGERAHEGAIGIGQNPGEVIPREGARVHRLGREFVGLTALDGPRFVLHVGERLDDGAIFIQEDDIAVAEHLEDEIESAESALEFEDQNPVKSVLPCAEEARVRQVLAQEHGEGGRLHRHRAVAAREVGALAAHHHDVLIGRALDVQADDDLLVMRLVHLLRMCAGECVEVTREACKVEG